MTWDILTLTCDFKEEVWEFLFYFILSLNLYAACPNTCFYDFMHFLFYILHFSSWTALLGRERAFYKTCLPGRGWERDTVQKSMLCSGKLDPYIETWMLTCLSIAITLIFNHGMGHFLKNNWVIIRLIQSHCENTNKKHNFRTYSVSLW